VDIGAALLSRHHAQTVADAAALAGARQLGGVYERTPNTIATQMLSAVERTRVLRAAAQVADQNRINLATLTLAELRIGAWNPASQRLAATNIGADALLVRASGQTSTFLAGLLGIRRLDIAATATAALTPLGEVPSRRVAGSCGNRVRIRRARPDRRQTGSVLSSRQHGPLYRMDDVYSRAVHRCGSSDGVVRIDDREPEQPDGYGQSDHNSSSSAATLPQFFRRSKPYTMPRKIQRLDSGWRLSRSTNAAPARPRQAHFVSPDFRPPSSRWSPHRTGRSSKACCGAGVWPSGGAAVPIMALRGVFPAWCRDGSEGTISHVPISTRDMLDSRR
jgi:hypothetical protein